MHRSGLGASIWDTSGCPSFSPPRGTGQDLCCDCLQPPSSLCPTPILPFPSGTCSPPPGLSPVNPTSASTSWGSLLGSVFPHIGPGNRTEPHKRPPQRQLPRPQASRLSSLDPHKGHPSHHLENPVTQTRPAQWVRVPRDGTVIDWHLMVLGGEGGGGCKSCSQGRRGPQACPNTSLSVLPLLEENWSQVLGLEPWGE